MGENDRLSQSLRAGADCPSIDVLSGHLEGIAGAPEHRSAEAHLSQCLYCKTQIELLRQFESGAIRPEEEDDVRWISARLAVQPPPTVAIQTAPWWRTWLSTRALAGVAAVAAMAVAGIALSTLDVGQSRAVPEFGNEVQRSGSVEVIQAAGSFQWKAVPGAAQYELTVREVDHSVIFHNSVTTSALAYPEDVVRTISTGKLLLWDVVARDNAGNELARSGVQRLKSNPPSGQDSR